eukprot:gene678-8179_t
MLKKFINKSFNLKITKFSIRLNHQIPKTKLTIPQKIVENSPKVVKPYLYLMRLDKPIGTWLLLWPCYWSMLVAQSSIIPDPKLTFLFAVGALIMRGAGCTINDLYDKDLDNKVERTKTRPLASKQISQKQAVAFLAAQLSAGLAILLQFNTYSIIVGACSLMFVFTYPLFKRFTYWPQLMLGITFNWGAFIGYSSVMGYCDWYVTVPMYIAGIAWTIIYDTIYAHQDKKDDVNVGIKSTALLFGDKTKEYLTAFSAVFGSMMCLSGYYAEMGFGFYGFIFLTTFNLLRQIRTTNYEDTEDL